MQIIPPRPKGVPASAIFEWAIQPEQHRVTMTCMWHTAGQVFSNRNSFSFYDIERGHFDAEFLQCSQLLAFYCCRAKARHHYRLAQQEVLDELLEDLGDLPCGGQGWAIADFKKIVLQHKERLTHNAKTLEDLENEQKT